MSGAEQLIPVMLTRETIENMLYGGGKPEDHSILTRAFLDALNASEEDRRLAAFTALTEGNFFSFTDPEHQEEYIWQIVDAVLDAAPQPQTTPQDPEEER